MIEHCYNIPDMNEEKENKVVAQTYNMYNYTSFDTLKEILSKANKVGRMDIFSLPNKATEYYDKDNKETIGEFTNLLLDIERDEDWRMTRYGNYPRYHISKEDGEISFTSDTDKSFLRLLDIEGAIVVAKLQSIIIIPGPKTAKYGNFKPNEAIRLINLLNDSVLLCELVDTPVPDKEDTFSLSYKYNIIANHG